MKPLNITYIYDYANLQVEEVRGSNISLKLLGHNFVRCDCLYCARRVNDWTFQSVISGVTDLTTVTCVQDFGLSQIDRFIGSCIGCSTSGTALRSWSKHFGTKMSQ